MFAGTVNADVYLRDETGNRRFWPVRCLRARLDELQRDRDQIWAEATSRFRQGIAWWLDDAGLIEDARREQADRLQADPWQETIESFVSAHDDVSVAEILADALKKDADRWERKDEMRVAATLKALGWERYKRRVEGVGNKFQWRYRLVEG